MTETTKFYYEGEHGREEVALERWAWGMRYADGTELRQFEEYPEDSLAGGVFHRIGEVDQDRIVLATLFRTDETPGRIAIPWRPGMRLIHKYRHVVLDAGTTDEYHYKIYMFGWKLGAAHCYFYVLPDGRIVASPEDDAGLEKFLR